MNPESLFNLSGNVPTLYWTTGPTKQKFRMPLMTRKTVDSVELGHPSGQYKSSVCTFISAAITTATKIMWQNIRI